MSSKVLHILFVLLFISKNCIGCWGGGIGVPIFLYGGLGSGKSSKIKTKQVLPYIKRGGDILIIPFLKELVRRLLILQLVLMGPAQRPQLRRQIHLELSLSMKLMEATITT